MKNAVKDFVVNVLGCGCPEEVFSSILLDIAPGPIGGIPLAFTIRIGGRLMVLGVADEKLRSPQGSLATLVAAGMGLRDGEGFYRLRIVVISDDPELEALLRAAFAGPGARRACPSPCGEKGVARQYADGRGNRQGKEREDGRVYHQTDCVARDGRAFHRGKGTLPGEELWLRVSAGRGTG